MATTHTNDPLHSLNLVKTERILVGLLALTAVISLLLQTRVQTAIFPTVRENRITQLIKHSRASRAVDLKEFWQLRDEYGFGTFTLSPDHNIYRETQELVTTPVSAPRSQLIQFATYSSPLVQSQDYLFTWWQITPGPESFIPILDVLSETNIPATRRVFQDEDTRIYLKDDNQLVVVFIKPITEIATVYGLYDWTSEKITRLNHYYFASVTTFTLDCCQGQSNQFTESFVDKLH